MRRVFQSKMIILITSAGSTPTPSPQIAHAAAAGGGSAKAPSPARRSQRSMISRRADRKTLLGDVSDRPPAAARQRAPNRRAHAGRFSATGPRRFHAGDCGPLTKSKGKNSTHF